MRLPSKLLGALFLFAFATPFLLVGAGNARRGWRGLQEYERMGAWQPVPVRLTDLSLRDYDEDQDIIAAYTYRVGDREYTGSRVDVLGGGSGDFDRFCSQYGTLKRHFDQGLPFQALVNPAQPAESVLFREKDSWMLGFVFHGLTFVFGGLGVTALGVYVLVGGRRLDPERPWHTRRDWRRGVVAPTNTVETVFMWFVAGFFGLLMAGFVAISGGKMPVVLWGVWGLFVLLGVWVLYRALLLTARRLAHGAAVLQLAEVPVVPGYSAEARVRTRRPVEADRWELELRCVVATEPDINGIVEQAKKWARKSGHRPDKARRVFQGECVYALPVSPDGAPRSAAWGATVLPVTLHVPADAPETWLGSGKLVWWELAVRAKARPFAFAVDFELPVFKPRGAEVDRRPLERG